MTLESRPVGIATSSTAVAVVAADLTSECRWSGKKVENLIHRIRRRQTGHLGDGFPTLD